MDCLKSYRPMITELFGNGIHQILTYSNNGMDLPLEVYFILIFMMFFYDFFSFFRFQQYYFVLQVMFMNLLLLYIVNHGLVMLKI